MNYFTKEQLEDITNSILMNPVIETLKELYNKYSDNKIEEVVEETTGNIENTEIKESENNNMMVTNDQETPVVNNTVEMPIEESNKEVPGDSLENTINIPIFNGDNNTVSNNQESVVTPIPSVIETPSVSVIPNVVEAPAVNPLPNNVVVNNTPAAPIPSFVSDVPDVSNEATNVQKPSFTIPSFSAPEVNVPPANAEVGDSNQNLNMNLNNNAFNSVPFGGNLWEVPTNGMNNLMQTTDNFNAPEENKIEPVKEQMNVPFFGGPSEAVNNPIPVQEKPQNYGPTMFGQFEQNYRG